MTAWCQKEERKENIFQANVLKPNHIAKTNLMRVNEFEENAFLMLNIAP